MACAALAVVAASRIGYARGILRPVPPREAAFEVYDDDHAPCPPRYIHQIFGLRPEDGGVLPADWERGKESWIAAHDARAVEFDADHAPMLLEESQRGEEEATWRYFLWDGAAVDALLRDDFPKHLRKTYAAYPRWVQRADLARYAILHRYGGVYADLDVMARRSFEPLRALCPEVAVARADQALVDGAFLSPDLLIARKGHQLLASVLEAMPAKAATWSTQVLDVFCPYLAVMRTTGPMHLTAAFLSYTKKRPWPAGALVVLGDGYYTGAVTDRKLVGHLAGRTWHEWDVGLWSRVPPAKFLGPAVAAWVAAAAVVLRHRRRRRRAADSDSPALVKAV